MSHDPDSRRNVELKASDPSPDRSLEVCRRLGAEDRGVLAQRDTYFVVPRGRLKLREEPPRPAQLVQYERSDSPEQRESRYRLVETADAAGLKLALGAALGVLAVVEKERRLFLWEGVRIHLDRVAGLGSFIEFEAVAEPHSDLSRERARVAALRRAFDVDESRLVASSYSNLLLAR